MAAYTDEDENFFRIFKLVTSVGTDAIRIQFDILFPPADLESELSYNEQQLKKLKARNRLNAKQWDVLFPSSGGIVSSNDFDITLMICLIRNIPSIIIHPINGYDHLPPSTEKTAAANIARIKHFRNTLAHSDNHKINQGDFNTFWTQLSEGIVQLGGSTLQAECDKIMDLRITSSAEIEALKYQITCVKDELTQDIEKLTDEVEQLKTVQTKVPDWMIKVLQKWKKEDDKYFVETTASNHVLSCLLDNECVSVVGPPGVGKTFLVQHVALEMDKIGFNVIRVDTPDNIKQNYQISGKFLFVVDDMCGNFTANTERLDIWKRGMKDLTNILNKDCCKMILTCRLQVFQDEGFTHSDLQMFQTCKCNLLDEKLALTSSEKEKIAIKYFCRNYTNKFKSLFKYDFFPLLCKLYVNNKNFAIQSILKDPFHCFRKELNNLFTDSKEGKYKICALLFLTVCNNRVEKKCLAGRDKRVNNILEDICYECDINEKLTGKFIMKELDALTGTFVFKDEEIYHTIHDKLFDFIAHYFGKKNEITKTEFARILIKHAEYNFVRERFVIEESCQSDDTNSEVYLITIQYDDIPFYVERVFSDLTNSSGVCECIWGYRNSHKKSFHNTLSPFLSQLHGDTITKLIQNASSDFVCIMFVTNVNEITPFASSQVTHNSFGILLNHDHIQTYIERMFDDLTKSNNVESYIRRCRCCRCNSFCTKLLIFMSKLSPTKVADLIQNASASFVMAMFVMEKDEINQRCNVIEHRFGIQISRDHMQFYFERFLNEIKYCSDVPEYISLCRCSRNMDFNMAIQSFMSQLSTSRIKELVQTASDSFIQNMLVITLEDTKQISRHIHRYYEIEIPDDVIQIYIERVFDGLTSSKDVNEHLQCNRNRSNIIFQNKLQDHMRQLGGSKIKHLIKIASQDFIDRLCVISIDDIGDFCDREYNRYGVIISSEVMQVYMERVFDGITCSYDVDEQIQYNRNKRNTIFQTRLLDYMRQIGGFRIKLLIETATQDFIDRICVLSIDNIQDNCVFEYERYGVVIPDDCILLYIARWFDGMPAFDVTKNYIKRNRNRKTKLFRTSLRTFIEQLQEDEIGKLIQSGNTDFLHTWFITTKEDLENSFIKDYEQCGIIPRNKNLHEYNERILTLMTCHRLHLSYEWSYKCRIPRSVIKYINELQIARMIELINNAHVKVFHRMIIVDIEKELDKIYSDSQSVDYVNQNIIATKDESIRCPESLINQYMDRMITDWSKGAIFYVILNKNLENQFFVDKFLSRLTRLEPAKISELLQIKDNNLGITALTLCCEKNCKIDIAIWCLENSVHSNQNEVIEHFKWCFLLLIVVFNNKLDQSISPGESIKADNVILSYIEICGIPEDIMFSEERDEPIDLTLKGTVVIKEDTAYVISEKVFDFIVFYFTSIRHMSKILVEYADEILLYNKFLVEMPVSNQHGFTIHLSDEQLQTCIERVYKSLYTSEKRIRHVMARRNNIHVKSVTAYIRRLDEKEINTIIETACIDFLYKMCTIVTIETKEHIVEKSELYIAIQNDSILIYMKRIFDHLAKSDCVEACLQDNRNVKCEIFRTELLFFMKEINRDDIETLINQASSDFISRMFIMSDEDIKEESCWEYERYGIFIPTEFLQMYIKRVFSDMTQSVNLPVNRNSENTTFKGAFHLYTNSLSEDILTLLIQTASSKFINRLFLSSEENSTEIRSQWFECSLVFVPKNYYQIFEQRLEKHMKSQFQDGFIMTDYKVNNDEISLGLKTYEDKEFNDVLIRMRRTNKKNIGIAQLHLIKYIDPLFTGKTIECCVISTKSLVTTYIQRMLADWIEGHIHDVFGNINLSNLSFQSEFLTYLRNTENAIQTKLANTNDKTTRNSPLAVCCYVGNSQLAEWCLDKNINTNSCNKFGEHPLYIACAQNRTNIVLKLLNQKDKSDIDLAVYNKTLHEACKSGLDEVVWHLLKTKVDINSSTNYETPLFVACENGYEEIVSILLHSEAEEIDVNKGSSSFNDSTFKTPLYIACKKGLTKIVTLLLNHKSDEVVAYKGKNNLESPLYAACEGGYTDIVSLLLKHEFNGLNQSRIDGTSSLFVACRVGHVDVVESLLKQKGIEIDNCMLTGMSPLFIASLLHHTKIVEMLLRRNADVNKCIKTKDKVNQVFKIHRDKYTFDFWANKQWFYLNEFTKFISELICDNASGRVKSYIDGLEEDGVPQLFFGSSPLHIGSLMGHIRIVTLLVDRTSSIDCFTENGSTPLFLACEFGHDDIVRVLLDKNANPNLERKDGKTPLSIARENGHLGIADIIIPTVKGNLYHSENISEYIN